MPWLLASPGNQHPWYWLCSIGKLMSYSRKDFNYLCHDNVFVPSGKIACEWLRPIYFNSIEGARAGWSPPGAVSLGWFLSDSAYRAVLPGYYKTNIYKFHCILGAVIFENKSLCIINRLSSNNVNIRVILATIGSDKGFSPPGNIPLSKPMQTYCLQTFTVLWMKHQWYSQ